MRNSDIASIERIPEKNHVFKIGWLVTSLCNYACSFCIQGNRAQHVADAKGESRENRDVICERISELITQRLSGVYDKVDMNLIGGEVTILPDFPAIVERLAGCSFEKEMIIHLTTNLSAADDTWEKITAPFLREDLPGKRVISISCSYYPEYTDFETFAGHLDYLRGRFQNKPDQLILNCNYLISSDEDYQAYLAFSDALQGKARVIPNLMRNYPVTLSGEIRQKMTGGTQNYLVALTDGTEKHFGNIVNIGFHLEDTDLFNPNGYYCDAGIGSIRVRNNGIVDRCPNYQQNKPLGSALEGPIPLLTDVQQCQSLHCSCNVFQFICKDRDKANELYNSHYAFLNSQPDQ